MKPKAIIVSGYFNPLHKGHLELFEKAKTQGDALWVIINSDLQRKLKGSKAFMDEDERLFHGEFDTPTQAIVACQKIMDANIESITEDETDPDKAYESYVCFGDDPWIQGIDFSAFEYAKLRIQEVLRG